MDLRRLADPFPAGDLEWRIQSCGKKGDRIWALVLAYVDNRAIMDRLDEVCGPENWKNEFRPGPDGGIVCGLSIRIVREGGVAEWVTKWDGAENTDVAAVKGGLSGAMKRAGAQWSIGRFLYNLGESFANVHPEGAYRGKTKDGDTFKWDPPQLPAWALPSVDPSHQRLLDFIKEAGGRGGDAVQAKIRPLWETAKRDRREAKALAELVEEGTGERMPQP